MARVLPVCFFLLLLTGNSGRTLIWAGTPGPYTLE